MPQNKCITPNDRIVGENIKKVREAKALTQTWLADQLHITFQQIQKYEKGVNRVSAGKLFTIASLLECDLMELFAGCE